jgi:hypothetical protein
MVTMTVQGGIFLPRYHGRAYVQILGEESDGQVIPARYRPKPNPYEDPRCQGTNFSCGRIFPCFPLWILA